MSMKLPSLAAGIVAACVLAGCLVSPLRDYLTPEATCDQVSRVEPMCWWTGMHTPLQLMVHGEDISSYDVRFSGLNGVRVKEVHRADSPNYLFLDIDISPRTKPGIGRLVFTRDTSTFAVSYGIYKRPDDSGRKSFSSEDLIYLIVPDRFANADPSNDETSRTRDIANPADPNARHGGDIKGIIEHLDYLEDLGVTAIWPTPLLTDNDERVSYHGYACSDYYYIDPRFGDNWLYRRMVKKAHEKGIKVIMDVVTNHCGLEHWWMKDLPFKDWVHVHDTYQNTNHVMSLAFDPNASASDRKQMEEGWFVPSMPDMNLDNPYVLNYFRQWAIWWIAWSGLDGLRVDTWYYNEKEPLSRWAASVREEFPWINIVGEAWSLLPDYVAYWQAGHPNLDGFDSHLPSVMDFPLMNAINRALAAPEGDHGLSDTGSLRAVYDALSHDFGYSDAEKLMVFFSNHDSPRLADVCGGDPGKMKIALTMMATLRGIPQLFYGEEWMLRTGTCRRDDGRVRFDFPGGWQNAAVDLFEAARLSETGDAPSDAPAYHSGRRGFDPSGNASFAVLPGASPTGSASQEVFDYARKLFRWRKGASVIHHGKTLHFLPVDNTYAYFRYDADAVVMVFLNLSDSPAQVPWERFAEITDGLGEGLDVITGRSINAGSQTEVAPHDALVLEFEK